MIGFGIASGIALLLFLFAYIAIIVYVNWPSDREIAADIRVSREWSEILISPALTTNHRSQSIILKIENFNVDRNSNNFDVRLSDGTVVSPEIEIYDESGTRFEMRRGGFSMKRFDGVVFRPDGDLPSEREYKKVRIRSDIPFNCEQIYWRDYDPK